MGGVVASSNSKWVITESVGGVSETITRILATGEMLLCAAAYSFQGGQLGLHARTHQGEFVCAAGL